MEEIENPTAEPKEIDINDRINTWLNMSVGRLSQTTITRYRQGMNTFLKTYSKTKKLLCQRELTDEDLIVIVNDLTQWVFRDHKVYPYFYAYAMFGFMSYYFGDSVVLKFKKKMSFVQKTSEQSNRVVRDVSKIRKILDLLEEPYDLMGEIEWQTGCRYGALAKLKFGINLLDPRNGDIVRGIKDKILNIQNFSSTEDDFWKREDGFCMIKLKEKRGHILERLLTPETFQDLLDWKEQRFIQIRKIMHQYYNEKKKLRFKWDLNTKVFPCSLNTYDTMLHKASYSVGIQKFSSHFFRGTRATLLHEMGMSPKRIQILLGHKSPSTTMRYISPDTTSKEELQKYLDILNKK